MPYDLYGNYYDSEQDAINAELSQMAAIDASKNTTRLYELQDEVRNFIRTVKHLEGRIQALEKKD